MLAKQFWVHVLGTQYSINWVQCHRNPKDGVMHVKAGAGIIADSNPVSEHR